MKNNHITVNNTSVEVCRDGNINYVEVSALEKALGWGDNNGRKKIASKSLKAFAGKELSVGKKSSIYGGTRTFLSTIDTMVLIAWEAQNCNPKAAAWLIAFAVEALDKRIDVVLGTESQPAEVVVRWLAVRMNHASIWKIGKIQGSEANKLHMMFYGVDVCEHKNQLEMLDIAREDLLPDMATLELLEEITELRKRFVIAKSNRVADPYREAIYKMK